MKRRLGYPLFAVLLLSSFVVATFSPTATAQGATVVEIGSGTLDRSLDDGPRRERVDFDPLVSGSNTLRVTWNGDADIRFSIFRLLDTPGSDRVRIGTTTGTATPGEWTGTLDMSERYFLNVWIVEGSGNFTATIEAETAVPLAITDQPASLSVAEGEFATFTVTATGSGTLGYRWFADGTPIAGATDGTLILGPVTLDDSGTVYSVEVSDDGGTVVSNGATLTVSETAVPLAITTQPADLTVAEGEGATFTVSATGSGPLGYRWFSGSTPIPGATGDTLSLDAVTLDDSGTVYSVAVSDDGGTVVSDGATLTVSETAVPLAITDQPASLSVAEGEFATFTITATGSGTLGYRWFADGTPIAGATDGTLILGPVTLDDSGTVYSVEVGDGDGTVVSDGATLEVTPVSIAIVGRGTLDADKRAGPRWVRLDFDSLGAAVHTVTVSWDTGADVRFKVQEAGGNSVSSTVRGTNPGVWQGALRANEQYYIGLWSTDGVANYIATVEASVEPADLSITAQPANLTVAEGENATFLVTATGSGTLGYRWFADGIPVPGATGSTLSLDAVTLGDSGTVYSVEVSDDGGTLVSDGATLTVSETSAPLVITAQPENLTVAEGERATFTVSATGSGTLGYRWLADGTPIPGATGDTLILDAVTLGDSGTVYSVEVGDGNGTLVSGGATLEVVPVSIAIVGQGTLDADKRAGPRWVRLDFDSLGAAVHTVTVSWDTGADVRFKVQEAGGRSVSPTVRGTNPGVWQGELEANEQYYIGLWSTDGVANYIATVEASVDPVDPDDLAITAQPADLTVAEGEGATFSVSATGSGPLGYRWFADGTPVPGATGSTLSLGAVDLDDSGTVYSVEVGDDRGTVVSDDAVLTVEEPPATGGVVARWTMNEPAGASVMSDASGNGRDGTIGPDTVTGVSDLGATSYRWLFTSPTSAYQPGRIINVPHHPTLDPGSGDYSITMRYRTNVSFGNIIQKGQGGAPGGYWKIENPGGYLTCVFRGVARSGGWNRKEVVSSRPLNDGRYHTITCERVGRTLRLIVDGVLDDTAGNSTGSISNGQPMSIGGKTNCDNSRISCDYFSGWIDEISIGAPGAPAALRSLRSPAPEQVLFADDFSSGDFLVWEEEQSLSIDGTGAAPGALAELYETPGFAWTDIAPDTAVCAEVSVQLAPGSIVGAVDLLRMNTVSGGEIAAVHLDDDGQLVMRSDVSGATRATGVTLDGDRHRLRWCGTIGGAWSLGVDGFEAVTGWNPDTGSDPIGRFQIGTSQAGTITVRFDDVVVTTD